MPRLLERESAAVAQLASTEAAIRRALHSFQAGDDPSALLDHLSCAFSEVRQAAAMLMGFVVRPSVTCCKAIASYQSVLQEWQRQLPQVERWLLAERSSLESRSRHADGVRRWLKVQGQTR